VACRVVETLVTYLDDPDNTESIRARRLKDEHGKDTAHEIFFEHRQERKVEGIPSYCSKRVLSEAAYFLLQRRAASAKTALEVAKTAICFQFAGNYYEVCSLSRSEPGDTGCQESKVLWLDMPAGAPVPEWLAESVLDERRQLGRNTTDEAAVLVGLKRALNGTPVKISRGQSHLEALLASPKNSRVAMVISKPDVDEQACKILKVDKSASA